MDILVLFLIGLAILFISLIVTRNNIGRTNRIALMITFVLSVASFSFITILTIKPTTYSGNGNLAILVMPVASSTYLLFLIFAYKSVRNLTYKRPFPLLLVCCLCIVLLTMGEVYHVQHLIEALGGGPAVPESRIYRFGWFNQYTNTFYFNGYIFCIGFFLTLLPGIFTSLTNRN